MKDTWLFRVRFLVFCIVVKRTGPNPIKSTTNTIIIRFVLLRIADIDRKHTIKYFSNADFCAKLSVIRRFVLAPLIFYCSIILYTISGGMRPQTPHPCRAYCLSTVRYNRLLVEGKNADYSLSGGF